MKKLIIALCLVSSFAMAQAPAAQPSPVDRANDTSEVGTMVPATPEQKASVKPPQKAKKTKKTKKSKKVRK